jgi:hypothetical protein
LAKIGKENAERRRITGNMYPTEQEDENTSKYGIYNALILVGIGSAIGLFLFMLEIIVSYSLGSLL